MSHDILKEASQALRDVTAEDNRGDRFTRARVMASLHQQRQRRSTRLALFVPLAAILVGSTAWAGASGKLAEVWNLVSDMAIDLSTDTPQPVEVAPAPPRGRGTGPAAAPVEPQTLAPEEPEAEVQSDEPEESVAPRLANAGGRGPGVRGDRTEPAVEDSEARALALYRAAHRAHFGGADRAAALSAWDEYLRVEPNGRFSVEARYNRALCLVSLGRGAEARAALLPFARGAYGGYRRQEATELVEALGGSEP